MAQLNFDRIINMTTHARNSQPRLVDKLIIGNEPDNSIFQYYLKDNHLKDKKGTVVYANYNALSWELPASSVTTKQVISFGIKTFPGVGAIGFYEPLVGNSKIVLPIHIKRTAKYDAPILFMTESNDNLICRIVQPDDMVYTCFRIIVESTYNAFEYITYDLECTIPKPTVHGTYRVYCIGYIDEGSYISEDSNDFEVNIRNGSTYLLPKTTDYVSAAEFEERIGYLEDLLAGY